MVQLNAQGVGRENPGTARELPPAKIGFMPFEPEKDDPSVSWVKNSLHDIIYKQMSGSYQIEKIDTDLLIKELADVKKRNLSTHIGLRYLAARVNASALVFGTYLSDTIKGELGIKPSIYLARTDEIIALETILVPVSSQMFSQMDKVSLAVNENIEKRASKRSENEKERALSFSALPNIFIAPFKVEGETTADITSLHKSLSEMLAQSFSFRPTYQITADKTDMQIITAIKPHNSLPDIYQYEIVVTIHNAERKIVFDGALNEQSLTSISMLIMEYLNSLTFEISGQVNGNTIDGLVIKLDSREKIQIKSTDLVFSFKTKLPRGADYKVELDHSKSGAGQDCNVLNSTGEISLFAIKDIQVVCVPRSFPVSFNVQGYEGGRLVIQLNGSEKKTLSRNGKGMFETHVNNSASYSVTVLEQPLEPAQSCIAQSNEGFINAREPQPVVISCRLLPQHILYLGGLYSFAVQPGGPDNFLINGSFPYNKTGPGVMVILGTQNKYVLPWNLIFGIEAGYWQSWGKANFLDSFGEPVVNDGEVNFSGIQALFNLGYEFRIIQNLSLIIAIGSGVSRHTAYFQGDKIYETWHFFIPTTIQVRYFISSRFFIETIIRSNTYLTDTPMLNISAGFSGGYKL